MMTPNRIPGPIRLAVALAAAGALLAACQPEGTTRLAPVDLASLEFVPFSIDEGIHPDQSVLRNPHNPFAGELPSDGTGPQGEPPVKWNLAANPVAAFYSWASFLARQPNGENQYYAALSLGAIRQRLIDRGNADPALVTLLTDMAARAYQSVLDNFPGAVSFLADGMTSFELAPLAVQGILALGKPVLNGWILVMGTNGPTVVRGR